MSRDYGSRDYGMGHEDAEMQRALDQPMRRGNQPPTADATQAYRIVALLETILAEQVKQRELLEGIATRIGH
jgi:hypothetical protein